MISHRNQILLRDQALIAFNLLLSRDLRRAARFLWCRPFDAALSICAVAARYATPAASLSFSEISFRSFLMDERSDERWLTLCSRRLVFCRARFLACGVLAKGLPL